ncbi:MAG TPA: pitrilysin family protein, partial [Thermoanaerobaculia bacterium]|nr:pitrilysin family protein [Thermoanaerobaculia bacterium]
HPYRRPGIGNIEELDAATLGDVQAFHRRYYRPDNAILIVAGDFDQNQLDRWIDKYLGVISKPSDPIPALAASEPPRTSSRRIAEHGPSVPLPAVLMTWLIPPAAHQDSPALTVAAAILSLGESSRLYQSLVYRQKIAQEAQADADLREDAGLFIALAVMASGRSPKSGESALMSEIAALARKPVSSAEMTKAKNQIIAGVLRERETNNGKASDLGNAIVLFHDPEAVNQMLTRIEGITPGDVQRVVSKYLVRGKPVIISYTSQKEEAPASGRSGAEGPAYAAAGGVQ